MRSMKFTQLCQLGTSYDLSSMERARSANSSQVEIGGSIIRKRRATWPMCHAFDPSRLAATVACSGVAQVVLSIYSRGLRMHSHSLTDRWLDSQWQIVSSVLSLCLRSFPKLPHDWPSAATAPATSLKECDKEFQVKSPCDAGDWKGTKVLMIAAKVVFLDCKALCDEILSCCHIEMLFPSPTRKNPQRLCNDLPPSRFEGHLECPWWCQWPPKLQQLRYVLPQTFQVEWQRDLKRIDHDVPKNIYANGCGYWQPAVQSSSWGWQLIRLSNGEFGDPWRFNVLLPGTWSLSSWHLLPPCSWQLKTQEVYVVVTKAESIK